MAARPRPIERQTGITLWRQIADRIRMDLTGLASGPASNRLLPETELATRFGVNRHTVRAAISALVSEGVLRAEQGRGTFITRRSRLTYPIGTRTRFSTGFEGQAEERKVMLTGEAIEPASSETALALGLDATANVVRLEMVSSADGLSLSVATHWFEAARFSGLGTAVARTGSVTAALAEFRLSDYVRIATRIEAFHADADDRRSLGLSPGAIVLVTHAVNADLSGMPFQHSITRFAADRVSLEIEHPRPDLSLK